MPCRRPFSDESVAQTDGRLRGDARRERCSGPGAEMFAGLPICRRRDGHVECERVPPRVHCDDAAHFAWTLKPCRMRLARGSREQQRAPWRDPYALALDRIFLRADLQIVPCAGRPPREDCAPLGEPSYFLRPALLCRVRRRSQVRLEFDVDQEVSIVVAHDAHLHVNAPPLHPSALEAPVARARPRDRIDVYRAANRHRGEGVGTRLGSASRALLS